METSDEREDFKYDILKVRDDHLPTIFAAFEPGKCRFEKGTEASCSAVQAIAIGGYRWGIVKIQEIKIKQIQ